MHSHHRDIRGQSFLVCSNCVAAHPKQLPKLHSGIPLLTQVVEQRRLARESGAAAAASGKRRRVLSLETFALESGYPAYALYAALDMYS
eukprot:4477919-Amphidinium_carterae.1